RPLSVRQRQEVQAMLRQSQRGDGHYPSSTLHRLGRSGSILLMYPSSCRIVFCGAGVLACTTRLPRSVFAPTPARAAPQPIGGSGTQTSADWVLLRIFDEILQVFHAAHQMVERFAFPNGSLAIQQSVNVMGRKGLP